MAHERSYDYFWNSNSDRYYDADSMSDWLQPFFRNGVFNGELQVTANDDMTVTVATGHGYINGKLRHFIEETTLDIETASGSLDRIDSIMIRRDDTERMIYLTVEKGGNSSSPTAPEPTREGAIYDLKIAEVYVAAGVIRIEQQDISDTRMNSDVCGWVAATVDEIDFTQIQAQFDAYFTSYKKNVSDQYQNYIAAIKDFENQAEEAYDLMCQVFDQYEVDQREKFEEWIAEQEADFETWSGLQQETFAEWRQDQEDLFNIWYANNTGAWKNEFMEWFENLKDTLGEDTAGNLQNEIDELREIIYSTRVPANLITSDGDNLVASDGDQLIAFWTIKTSETCHCI